MFLLTFDEPAIFERAFEHLRHNEPDLKEERAMLLEEWLNVESGFGALGDVSIVQKKLPRKVKRKRAISTEDGAPAGYLPLFLAFFSSTNSNICAKSISAYQYYRPMYFTSNCSSFFFSFLFFLQAYVYFITDSQRKKLSWVHAVRNLYIT